MDKKKIIIVEDDESLIKLISEALGSKNYDVKLVLPNSVTANKIAEEKPAIIVLDIMLPGKSGFEFLEELKANEKTKKIPVIILSNLGQDEEIRKGLGLGAIEYIVKADHAITEIIHKITKAIKSYS